MLHVQFSVYVQRRKPKIKRLKGSKMTLSLTRKPLKVTVLGPGASLDPHPITKIFGLLLRHRPAAGAHTKNKLQQIGQDS